jgi:hypothetical protein
MQFAVSLFWYINMIAGLEGIIRLVDASGRRIRHVRAHRKGDAFMRYCFTHLLMRPQPEKATSNGRLRAGKIECTAIWLLLECGWCEEIARTFIGSYSATMREEKRPRWGVRTSNPRKDRLPVLGGFDSHSLPP